MGFMPMTRTGNLCDTVFSVEENSSLSDTVVSSEVPSVVPFVVVFTRIINMPSS